MKIGESSNMLPPKEERIFEETMSRKVITSRGTKWQTRHACLTNDRLIFSRSHHDSADTQHLPELQISTNELWAIFDQIDSDKNGYPIYIKI